MTEPYAVAVRISQMELVSAILKNIDRQGVKELNPRQMNAVIDAANSIVDEFEKLSNARLEAAK